MDFNHEESKIRTHTITSLKLVSFHYSSINFRTGMARGDLPKPTLDPLVVDGELREANQPSLESRIVSKNKIIFIQNAFSDCNHQPLPDLFKVK